MYTEDAMLKLVDLVYATACDPSKWESFLQALSDAVGGSGADILTMTSGDRPAVHVQIGVGIVGPELRREYRVAGARDPFMLAAKRVGFFRTGAIGIGEAFVPTSQLLRSEFYNDVGKRFDYVGGLSAVIAINPKVTSAISVCRHPNASFGEPDVALIRALMPHLQRAVQVHTRLAEADARRRAHPVRGKGRAHLCASAERHQRSSFSPMADAGIMKGDPMPTLPPRPSLEQLP